MNDSNKIRTFSKSTNIALGVETGLLLVAEIVLLVFIAWYDKNYEAAWDGLAIQFEPIKNLLLGISGMIVYIAAKLLVVVLIPFLVLGIVAVIMGILEFNGTKKPIMHRLKRGSIWKIIHSVAFIALNGFLLYETDVYFSLFIIFHIVILVLAIMNLKALKGVTITETIEEEN